MEMSGRSHIATSYIIMIGGFLLCIYLLIPSDRSYLFHHHPFWFEKETNA